MKSMAPTNTNAAQIMRTFRDRVSSMAVLLAFVPSGNKPVERGTA